MRGPQRVTAAPVAAPAPAPAVVERERPKPPAKDKDGFQVVPARANKSQPNVWSPPGTSPTSGSHPPRQTKEGPPTSPISSPSPSKPPASPESTPASSEVPSITDDQIAAKARGLLEEWTVDPNDTENAIAVLKEEIPASSYSRFVMGMLMGVISQGKAEKERKALPALCAFYTTEDLLQPKHLQEAFVGALQKAKREELWVDVPRLWKNVGGVLCDCLAERVLEFEALAPMCETLSGDADCPELPLDFLQGVLTFMKQEDMDVFDADQATTVLTALGKKKKPKQAAKKVTTLEEFEAAAQKILAAT